jgi:hypothetical protein
MNPVRYRTKGETGTASKVSDRICQKPPKTGMHIASDPPSLPLVPKATNQYPNALANAISVFLFFPLNPLLFH